MSRIWPWLPLVLVACAPQVRFPSGGAPPSSFKNPAGDALPSSFTTHPGPEKKTLEPLTLVESVPLGAMTDDPAIANTDTTWCAMLLGAKRSIAIGAFYIALKPSDSKGTDRLQPVLDELAAAVKRGVSVRFLIDANFAKKDPAAVARVRSLGVTVREFDAAKSMGGVHHAKYMVIDEEDSYVGSANFDWRSLDHIHELGLRIRSQHAAAVFLSAFDADWVTAGGESSPARDLGAPRTPELLADAQVTPLLSPKGYLSDPGFWDLDRIVEALDRAKHDVRVQLLSFETVGHDGAKFEALSAALLRAAVRGVRVQVLLSNWQKSAKRVGAAQALARQSGIFVRFVNIPEARTGFIPFARVIHAKYLVVDESEVWLGTSNWGGDYFFKSRNVGALVQSAGLARTLSGIFDTLAAGPLSELVDPEKVYEVPRIGD